MVYVDETLKFIGALAGNKRFVELVDEIPQEEKEEKTVDELMKYLSQKAAPIIAEQARSLAEQACNLAEKDRIIEAKDREIAELKRLLAERQAS